MNRRPFVAKPAQVARAGFTIAVEAERSLRLPSQAPATLHGRRGWSAAAGHGAVSRRGTGAHSRRCVRRLVGLPRRRVEAAARGTETAAPIGLTHAATRGMKAAARIVGRTHAVGMVRLVRVNSAA